MRRPLHQRNDGKALTGHQQNGDFRRLLVESGMSHADLAKHLNVHVNTVSRWAAGKVEKVPGAVLAYLRLYRDVKGLIERA